MKLYKLVIVLFYIYNSMVYKVDLHFSNVKQIDPMEKNTMILKDKSKDSRCIAALSGRHI